MNAMWGIRTEVCTDGADCIFLASRDSEAEELIGPTLGLTRVLVVQEHNRYHLTYLTDRGSHCYMIQ